MTNEATTQTPATPAPTKAEVRAAELKAKREAKQAEKDARKAANQSKRENGVIGTLHQMLQVETGCTKREVLAALTEKFPDRDPIGMATTVGIQLSRLQKKHGKIVSRKQGERGLVYGYEKSVKFAPETSEGAPDKAAIVAQVAAQPEATPVAETPAPKGGRKGGKK
jgi:hypothetical protein